ncbi:hypothetical protein CF319_g8162 [Tilletia indica]|nr:hypothetical protein CF319_g8162 [Tilletia indica]
MRALGTLSLTSSGSLKRSPLAPEPASKVRNGNSDGRSLRPDPEEGEVFSQPLIPASDRITCPGISFLF